MVQFPTRGENTLDLIFTSHPSYQERCKSLPPISERSDHDIVLFDTAHQPVRSRHKRQTILVWKKADTEGIKAAFTKYSVKSFSSSLWQEIKGTINQVISDHVPTIYKQTGILTHGLTLSSVMPRDGNTGPTRRGSTLRVRPTGKDTEGLSTRTREISGKLTNGIWKMWSAKT